MKKVALVTGGSRGIGRATALLLAQSGYAVAVNYRNSKGGAEKTVEEIKAYGGPAIAIQADVSIEAEVVRIFREMDERLGAITALVNNAGILEQQMPVERMNAARITRIFATNVFGSMICAREAVKRMSIKNGGMGGSIVNVSSVAARLGSPNEYVDYAASKGAIDTFTIGLSKEVADLGIRVNAVRPGYIYTEMHASGGEPNRVDRLKSAVPLQRGGSADEVAQAILWLLSENAAYTTGAFIDVTGGK